MSEKVGNRSRGSVRYDDWVCVLCLNHNYSFRTLCNRCRQNTREQNAYLELCQQQLALSPTSQNQPAYLQSYCCGLFPQVLLLEVSDEPWEEQPYRREQPPDAPTTPWINALIAE